MIIWCQILDVKGPVLPYYNLHFGTLEIFRKSKEPFRNYYYRARIYDQRQSRFLSNDPAGQGANLYAYVGNNPTNRRDPSGLGPFLGQGGSLQPRMYDGWFSTAGKYTSWQDWRGIVQDIIDEGPSLPDVDLPGWIVPSQDLPAPEVSKGGNKLTWSASEAKTICNNFGNAASSCGGLTGTGYAQEICYAAFSLGSTPFCICGYWDDGVVVEYDLDTGGKDMVSCKGNVDIPSWIGVDTGPWPMPPITS